MRCGRTCARATWMRWRCRTATRTTWGDIISLQVYRKWGPGSCAIRPVSLFGPGETLRRVRQIEGAPEGETYDGEFAFTRLCVGESYEVGPMTIRPFRALHPVEAFGLRIEGPSQEDPARRVALFYTGDTDLCDSIVEGARGVDVLLSEVVSPRMSANRYAHGWPTRG